MSYTVCARVAQYIGSKIDEKVGPKDRLLDQVVGRSGAPTCMTTALVVVNTELET